VEEFTNTNEGKTVSQRRSIKFCVTCGNVATKIACFHEDPDADGGRGGATILERYCNTCVKSLVS